MYVLAGSCGSACSGRPWPPPCSSSAARSSRCWDGRSPRSCRGPVGCSPARSWSCGDGTADATSPCSPSSWPCPIYAGEPDTLVVLLLALVVFLVVLLGPPRPPVRRDARRSDDHCWTSASASVAGLGLAAPLVLPGLQLSSGSVRVGRTPQRLPRPRHAPRHLPDVRRIVAGRKPILRRPRPRLGLDRRLRRGHRRRPGRGGGGHHPSPSGRRRLRGRGRGRPAASSISSPLVSFLNKLPGTGRGPLGPGHPGPRVRPGHPGRGRPRCPGPLARQPAGAQLAGGRLRRGRPSCSSWSGPSVVATSPASRPPSGRGASSGRRSKWPSAWLVFGFLVLMGRRGDRRPRDRGRARGCSAIPSRVGGRGPAGQLDGLPGRPGRDRGGRRTPPTWRPHPAETALQKAVGTSIVGFGISSCLLPPTLGIQANVNIVYGVHELDSYDPLTPQAALHGVDGLDSGHYPLPIGRQRHTRWPRSPCSARWSRPPPTPACSASGSSSSPTAARGSAGQRLRQEGGQRGALPDPGASVATISPPGRDGTLPPVDAPGTAGDGDLPRAPRRGRWSPDCHHAPGPPAAAHRRPRMARVDRRQAVAPDPVQPGDAPGQDPAPGTTPSSCTTGRARSRPGSWWPGAP